METTQTKEAGTASVWKIDAYHTSLNFSARHMVISNVTGKFKEVAGEIRTKGEGLENAEITATVNVNSIDTNVADRDTHLKSADFFDAANHPEIKFKSTSIRKKGDNEYEVTGDLSIRGITKPITLQVEQTEVITDPYGMTRTGFEIKGSINRFDYDLKWNALLETGGAVVGKDIKISGDVEFIKEKEA
jgi:polyisoprenoid-binding protein YceI